MPAQVPTILAATGGFVAGTRSRWMPGPILEHAIEQAGSPGLPRLCFVGTATGDSPVEISDVYGAFNGTRVRVSHVALVPMPNLVDVRRHMLEQDVIWVGGGSTAALLAIWRLHGLDRVLAECWERGVVLGGSSAGSLCWHVGGTTDSFGPELQCLADGLGLVPFSNTVHYDSDGLRRPLFQGLVAEGALPAGYATDEGVALVYRGRELAEAVADNENGRAYLVEPRLEGGAVETVITPRVLAGR